MGLLDSIEKALLEQKSEAKKEEELKGIKVFDLPAPEQKFSWKMAFDMLKGKEVEKRPNRWHHQDIMLERGGNFDLIRVYKRQMSKEEGLKATMEFNKYMQDAIMGKVKPEKPKEKGFSLGKFLDLLRSASDSEVKMARGKSGEFNKMVEEEEKRRNARRNVDQNKNYKSVEISTQRFDSKNRDRREKESDQVEIQQVMGVDSKDGSVRNLGKMYRREMTRKEFQERKERGEKWRATDKRPYVRFEKEDDGLER